MNIKTFSCVSRSQQLHRSLGNHGGTSTLTEPPAWRGASCAIALLPCGRSLFLRLGAHAVWGQQPFLTASCSASGVQTSSPSSSVF